MSELDLEDRRVVVTGGRGFLGKRVCGALADRGAKVVAVGSADHDLTEQAEVRRLYADLQPSVVVHAAAAVGGIGANVANPGRFLYANGLMGLMMLEEGRLAGIDRFVLVSTTCAYAEDAPLPLHEDDVWSGPPVGATGPYGMAKRLLHEACANYGRQYGLDSAVLMLANLYGPEDNFAESSSHVIPALIRRYVEAQETGSSSITNWGSGAATREFLHVADAAEAVALACERAVDARPMNIGTGAETSIREVADQIRKSVGYTGRVDWDTSKPEGQARRYLDVRRAREVLGFQAQVSLGKGIAETVRWYRTSRPWARSGEDT